MCVQEVLSNFHSIPIIWKCTRLLWHTVCIYHGFRFLQTFLFENVRRRIFFAPPDFFAIPRLWNGKNNRKISDIFWQFSSLFTNCTYFPHFTSIFFSKFWEGGMTSIKNVLAVSFFSCVYTKKSRINILFCIIYVILLFLSIWVIIVKKELKKVLLFCYLSHETSLVLGERERERPYDFTLQLTQ